MQDRLRGAGTLTGEQARQLGTVGPAARSVGLAQDARISSTRLCYDAFKPVVSNTASGDVKARLDQRAYELWQSFDLLDHLLDGALTYSTAVPATGPQPIGIGCVEGPRGATHCVVERTGDLVARLRLRTASYANWPSVTQAASGAMLPDFPLINKSFELCYACADR
jgi:Ni,Fe-hydrogenase III large subunit